MNPGVPHLEFRDVCASYGSRQVLKNVSFNVARNSVIGLIGPANSGKTTLLKTINRTLDFIAGGWRRGSSTLRGRSTAQLPAPRGCW